MIDQHGWVWVKQDTQKRHFTLKVGSAEIEAVCGITGIRGTGGRMDRCEDCIRRMGGLVRNYFFMLDIEVDGRGDRYGALERGHAG